MSRRNDRPDTRSVRRSGFSKLLLCAAIVLAVAAFFPSAGRWLVIEDAFAHADAVLILSGNPVQRALAARDLYRQGKVDRIFIIPEPPNPYQEELAKLGLLEESAEPWSQRILVASGVPASRIGFFPEPADGTITEAMHAKQFFRERPPKQLVIVTSKSASRRARFIFRRLLRQEGITVFCYPSSYDVFQADRWWSQPRNALNVVMEYQKFFANALTLITRPQR